MNDKNALNSPAEPWVAALVAGLIACTFVAFRANVWLRVHGQVATVVAEAPPPLWTPPAYRVMSFGNFPVVVDWIWLQALLDPALSRLGPSVRSSQYYRFDLVTDLDPGNFGAYFSGGNLLVVIRDDAVGARDLLLKSEDFRKKVLATMPASYREGPWRNSWKLNALLAYTYLFEFHDLPKAAVAFKAGGETPGAPPYLKNLGERLSRPGGEYEVGLRLLNFMLLGAKTDPEIQKLTQQRTWLFVAQYVADLNRGFADFLRKEPRYRVGTSVRDDQMRAYLKKYFRDVGVSFRDPWGGTLSLDESGRIVTTTAYQKVFGLD